MSPTVRNVILRRKVDPVAAILRKYGALGASSLYIPDFNPNRATDAGAARMYQDDEETTAVTAVADPIASVRDSSLTGTTMLQATDGNRGTLRQGNANSRWCWRGDGSNDNLLTNLVPAVAGMTAIVALEANAASDEIFGTAGAANERWTMATSASGLLCGGVGTQTAVTINGGSDIRDIPGVAVLRTTGALVSLFWKPFTGAISRIYHAAQSGDPTTTVPFRIGSRNANGTSSVPLDGDIYAVFAIQAALTDAEIAAVADVMSR